MPQDQLSLLHPGYPATQHHLSFQWHNNPWLSVLHSIQRQLLLLISVPLHGQLYLFLPLYLPLPLCAAHKFLDWSLRASVLHKIKRWNRIFPQSQGCNPVPARLRDCHLPHYCHNSTHDGVLSEYPLQTLGSCGYHHLDTLHLDNICHL